MGFRRVRGNTAGRTALWAFISIFILVVSGPALGAGPAKVIRVQQDFSATPPVDFVPDEFIVVLNAQARGPAAAGIDASGRPTINISSLQGLIGHHGVSRFDRQFAHARPEPPGSEFHDLTGHYKVKIPAAANLEAVMTAFGNDPNVDSVEQIGIHSLYACATGTPRTPSETYFDNPPSTFNWPQWDLWDTWGIDADLAWDVETGDSSVVVVAMDSGTRYQHFDLGGTNPPGPNDDSTNGNIWVNPGEIAGNGVDDDGNGKVDDIVGWDFIDGGFFCGGGDDCSGQDNDPRDFNGHGTHIAGTMAAITNNGAGVAGIAGGFNDGSAGSTANGVKILVARMGYHSSFGGFVNMDAAAQALAYVTDLKVNRGINIVAVNASWGSSDTGGFGVAVDNLLAADIMLINAAGNGESSSSTDYLGSRSDVLDVAATDENGNRASFSNYGAWVDVAAPGVDIISTYHHYPDPANDYVAVLSGTSMAAPHVAGVAALLESCNPDLSGPQKFDLIVNSTCTPNSSNIGGLLNAKLALDAAGCGGGGGCTADANCDDGNFCNGAETCNAGSCQAGTPVSCEDNNACTTTGTCDESVDACVYDPVNCDDNDLCTIDTCDLVSGCANDPVICDAGEQCNSGSGLCEVPCDNDGSCEAGEDCNNCPGDCVSGSSTGAVCGNDICEASDGEDCLTCPVDCNGKQSGKPSERFCCGFGGQNPVGCEDSRCVDSVLGFACTDELVGFGGEFCCGNGTCETGPEGCLNCPLDCTLPEVCGDGIDNSCDGNIDCDDSACLDAPVCGCAPKGTVCDSDADCCSNDCHPQRGVCK